MRLDHLLSMEKDRRPKRGEASGGNRTRVSAWRREVEKKEAVNSQHGDRRVQETFFVVQSREPKGKKEEPTGGVAQMGEHLPCKQGVKSSNLFISTRGEK